MNSHKSAWPTLTLSSGVTTLCCGLLIVCLTIGALAQFAQPTIPLFLGSLAALALFFGITALRESDLRRIGWGCFIAYSVMVLYWAGHYDSKQWGDIGVYYRCGTADLHAARSINEWMLRCQSKAIGETSAFWTRSLLYTLPFGALFGEQYTLLKLYNALIHVTTVVVMYRVVKSWSDERTAFIATALFSFYPEWWFTSTMAMPDNLAMLGIVIFFHAVAKYSDAVTSNWKWLAGAILCFVCTDLLRTCGLIMFGAVILAALMSEKNERKRLFKAALCLAITTVAMGRLIVFFRSSPAMNQGASIFGILSGLDFSSGISMLHEYRWTQFFVSQVPEAHRSSVLIARVSEAFSANFTNLFEYWFVKLRYLFSGTGYFTLANTYGQYLLDNIPVPIHHMVTDRPAVSDFIRGYGVGVLLLAIVGIARRPAQQPLPRLALAFVAALILIVVGLWETQPRYVLIIVPALCQLATYCFMRDSHPQLRTTSIPKQVLVAIGGFSLVLMLVVTGLWFAAKSYANGLPRIVRMSQQAQYVAPDGTICNVHALPIEAMVHRGRIMLPRHGEGCYSFDIEVANLGSENSFFVSRVATPFLWEMTFDPVRFELRAGNTLIGNADFTNVISKYLVFRPSAKDVGSSTQTLQLTLHSVNLEANGVEIGAFTRLKK